MLVHDMKKYVLRESPSPIIALALHDGHIIPNGYQKLVHLTNQERMREEDPYTGNFIANLGTNEVIVNTSRFFVDLNRQREKAIYRTKDDAWGLQVWEKPLTPSQERKMMLYYEDFYTDMDVLIKSTVKRHGYFVVLDVHSYNHRRQSPEQEEPYEQNPEINIGTAHNLSKWGDETRAFIQFFSQATINGSLQDVRENIKFKGGGMSQWINDRYGEKGFVLSIEFKKTFMDEWTGRGDIDHILSINTALKETVPFLLGLMAQHKNH